MPEHPLRFTIVYGLMAGLLFAGVYDLMQVRFFKATLLGMGFWFCLAGYTLLLARMYRRPLSLLLLPLLSGTAVLCLLYMAHVRTFHLLLVDLLLLVWLRSLLFPSTGPRAALLEILLGGGCMLVSVLMLRLGMGMEALGTGLAVWLFFQVQALFFLWQPYGFVSGIGRRHSSKAFGTDRFERAYHMAQRLLGQGS